MRGFQQLVRQTVERPLFAVIDPLTAALVRRRIHPNALTTAGFLVTLAAGYTFHLGHLRLGGALVLLGGVFDLFDGRVARAAGLVSTFGSFYDSTLDRISEVAVFLGVLSYLLVTEPRGTGSAYVFIVLVAVAGSLMISYTRARAEALGLDCAVGLMQRPERVVLLGGATLLFGSLWNGAALKGALVLMAVLTTLTVLQRIAWVYRHTRSENHG
jgi:CDP-diacylglycerol---glycerol-3-phosphate 3-phosphatidyltransferase